MRDKGSMIVILSHIKYARDIIFVRDKNKKISALIILLTRKTQWTDYIDGIMITSVIVPMLTNYLGMPLIYLTAASFFPESEGVNVNANLRIL